MMSDHPNIETELGIQKYEIASIKDMLVKLDTKFDGMQSFMNKLYDVFVTQKELAEFKKNIEDDNKGRDVEIATLRKDNRRLVVSSAFISGVGFFAVLLKDVIIEAIITTFKTKT